MVCKLQKILLTQYVELVLTSNLDQSFNISSEVIWYHFRFPHVTKFIMFSDFLMVEQVFLSPQVRQSMIISNKHVIYDFSHKLLNNYIGSQEISRKSQNFVELLPSALSSSQNEKFVSASKNLLKNKSELFP